MEELGSRIDVIPAPREVPFTRHIGELLLRVVEQVDDEDFGQCMEAEFAFEGGSVVARSYGGDLHMASLSASRNRQGSRVRANGDWPL